MNASDLMKVGVGIGRTAQYRHRPAPYERRLPDNTDTRLPLIPEQLGYESKKAPIRFAGCLRT